MCRADVLNIIFGVMSTFAVFASGKASGSRFFMGRIKDEINGIGIEGTIVMVALCLLFYKKGEIIRKGINRIPAVIAAIFSIFMLIGKSYSMMGNWNFIFADIKQFVIACFVFCGYFLLFYLLLSMLFKWVSEHDFAKEPQKISWIPDYARKHVFLVSFMVIFVCWLPYYMVFFPGSAPVDGFAQLLEGLNIRGWRGDHFPFIVSLFFAGLFSIGRVISDNAGLALTVMVLFIIEACCCAWVCVRLKQWKLSDLVWVLTLIFYGIIPLFGEYAKTLWKDSLYFAVFAVYMVEFINICLARIHETKISLKQIVAFSLISTLACLCRPNGIYFIFPANIILIGIYPRNRKYLAVSFLAILCIFVSYKKFFLPALHVLPSNIKEAFSIPLQQTGRYLKYYPKDLTKHERQIIEQAFKNDVKKIVKMYNPELSDPLKTPYRSSAFKFDKDLKYFKVWGKMLFRHPNIYVEAFLHHTYRYMYPFIEGIDLYPKPNLIFWNVEQKRACGLDLSYYFGQRVRKEAESWVESWCMLPFLALTVSPGAYTWLLIISVGLLYSFFERWRMAVFVAPMFLFLCNLVGPVNGCIRYALPIIASTPALIAWLVICFRGRKKNCSDEQVN